jgi:Flp pilus assembly protein CpaB
MLLGVLLALLAGALVIYIVSSAVSNNVGTESVVVVSQPIPSGTVMGVSQIQTDFTVKHYPADNVPAGAYIFTSQDALNVRLTQMVTTADLYPGDVLLATDPRFALVGQSAPGSLTSLNPSAIQPGQILFPLAYSQPTSATRGFVVAGDKVDVLVQECGTPWVANGGCSVETTYQNLLVYSVFNGSIIVVTTPRDAQYLKLLASTGNVTLAIRKPGDNSTVSPSPVTPQVVTAQFPF